jgi:hypothetical protein
MRGNGKARVNKSIEALREEVGRANHCWRRFCRAVDGNCCAALAAQAQFDTTASKISVEVSVKAILFANSRRSEVACRPQKGIAAVGRAGSAEDVCARLRNVDLRQIRHITGWTVHKDDGY